MSEKTWSVKNQTTGETRENLPQSEFIRWASELHPTEVEKWSAALSGSHQWNPISAISAFRLRRFGLPAVPSELAFTHAQLGWLEKSLDQRKQETQPPVEHRVPAPHFLHERRAHERFKARLQVVIVSEENAFRTFTRDISLGGLALEKPIPRNLTGSVCTIFISDPSSHRKISFAGIVIPEQGKPEGRKHRIRFEQMEPKAAEDLASYIQIALADHEKAA